MINSLGISLVCATYGRTEELKRLLESLKLQTDSRFELILVDQNENPILDELVRKYRTSFTLVHLRQSEANNSTARNRGVSVARYDWIGFPDDDCWYPPDFIARLLGQELTDNDGLFINWMDPTNQPPSIRFHFLPGILNVHQAFSLISCICLFLKRTTFLQIGGFNEKLGLGTTTLLKAGEEQELTLRYLEKNKKILKQPTIFVYHEMRAPIWNTAFEKRILSQGAIDFQFTKRFLSHAQAYRLLVSWMAGILYNIVRARRRNYLWYWLKLKGALTAPHLWETSFGRR